MRKKILFCSDSLSILENYRESLMQVASERYQIEKGAWFSDGFLSCCLSMLSADGYISSNLRSNFVCLLFFWKRGVVILNGLGRYEKNRFVRRLFVGMSKLLPTRKFIVAQSYRDYRYLTRVGVRACWVPGSGGSQYTKGKSGTALLVTRDSKVACIVDSLRHCYEIFDIPVSVVGCRGKEWQGLFEGISFESLGYMGSKEEMFALAATFIQPDGYGEGISHSLVDAICSDYEILIDKKVLIKSGFYRLIDKAHLKGKGQWLQLDGSNILRLQKYVAIDVVNRQYVGCIGKLLGV